MGCDALFQPLTINNLTLRSRVIMGSMHVGLEGLENGIHKLTEFYKRRAAFDVGLIVTGGAAVNPEGSGGLDFMTIYEDEDVERWKPLTQGVHDEGGAIALQLFHAGRYAYKIMTGMNPVAPSPLQSPINPDKPAEMNHEQILKTIDDFAQGARRAKEAGFDAVEIMGSEGYLINQFVSPATNKRTDEWGGTFNNRLKFPVEIMKAVREAVGPDYPVLFRMSGLDLIDESTTELETLQWAREIEKAGADVLNIGIGWHESKVPTISMKVPRMQFVPVAENIAKEVSIPVVASNRINDPRDANKVLEEGTVQLVSMARPFLADPAILTKGKEDRYDEVNTCIACNQACLDHVFEGKAATCLVNPEAGRETELTLEPAEKTKNLLIIGAGPAGLETARVAAERGHHVTLVDEKTEIGGQLNYSKQIPGKQEFYETLRYYRVQMDKLGVDLKLGERLSAEDPLIKEADEIVIATGIVPRMPEIEGVNDKNILSYRDVFEGTATTGSRVTIIGGGGIACDLALFLKGKGVESITLLQRSTKFARGIGKTTRWATLMELKQMGIKMIGGIEAYERIDGQSVTFIHEGEQKTAEADTVVLAAGQLINDELAAALRDEGKNVHIIGGAKDALGLDAKKAIYDGAVLARAL
ncbi:FAD-dependent oxidoreductase [Salipaludibacillus aurantiacus]|uniref:2,4-dienoyl-CoA reductase (NADPH2) n=1 Tax=Salipaludibacillus aurantiacus TaxID=1601833 RepID=A0A1H9VB52_9BACI|nr:FAD-dependent oxidoreductase [Salipaludibacillus aurantiacus]SES18751.1 2,4-dienoyl-CoA reductase (NADPH2) [Salipaludibacillus aurantiacus]